MSTASNIAQVSRNIMKLAQALDLDGESAKADTFGDELLDIVAVGERRRALEQQATPDGEPWAPNEERYAASPRKAGKPVGILDDEMLSIPELSGRREITTSRARSSFAITSSARRKGLFFGDGTKRQPARAFIGFDPEIIAEIDSTCEERVNAVLRELES
jgi:hypothetical protein